MRILLAAPDRDLLQCGAELLAGDAETVTAFDGTQVISLLEEERFDLALLDRSLPRIESPRLIARLLERGVPVVVLLHVAVTLPDLMTQPLPSDYLSYPFGYGELLAEVRDVSALAASGERVAFADMEADAGSFCLNGSERITASEFRALRTLVRGEPPEAPISGAYIGALNEKLAKLNSRVRIRYAAGKGYGLVQDE